MRALILLALAACTYEQKVFEPPDAAAGPFTCIGAKPPTTAPPVIKISGTAQDAQTGMPLIGASVQLQTTATGSAIASTFSDFSGHFSFDQNTAGVPVTGIDIHASATNFVDTYYFPAGPIAGDLAFDGPANGISLVSTNDAAMIFSAFSLSMTNGDGHVLLSIKDCLGTPLSGATVASTPAGTNRYFTGVVPAPGATATQDSGIAIVANLPPGNVTLNGTADGHALPAQVTVVAGAFSVTDLQP